MNFIGKESNAASSSTNELCYNVAERTISQPSDFSAANDYAAREIGHGTSRPVLRIKPCKKSMNNEERIHDLSRAMGELLTELEHATFGTQQNGLDIFSDRKIGNNRVIALLVLPPNLNKPYQLCFGFGTKRWR